MGKFLKYEYTDDQVKQVEFLRKTYSDYFKSQNRQYKDLQTKSTFLFGFVVATLTFYGSYATNINPQTKYIALGLFGLTALLLCLAYKNRIYFRTPMLDADVGESSYPIKVHKEAVNIKAACIRNKEPLQATGKWVRWSIWAFTLGLIFLILSFMLPH